MKFYAYLPRAGVRSTPSDPTKDAPMGTENKLLFELQTVAGAHRRARAVYGARRYRLFRYTNFYNDSTFKEV